MEIFEKTPDVEFNRGELRRSFASNLLLAASKIGVLEGPCLSAAISMEGGMVYSLTARHIMQKRYGVSIGAFSYGGCFTRGAIPNGVIIGRYVSVGPSLKIFRRDRFIDWLSLHPFFFNPLFGFTDKDPIISEPLVIEHDVWIGERVLVTPGCKRIGLGAVIGAGAVVTKDVPDFAMVAGNPARLIRFRFSQEIRDLVVQSRWWLLPLRELVRHLPAMNRPLRDAELLRALEALSKTPSA